MQTILLISPYWKEPHRWMVSSYKLAELWQRLGYRVVVACMGSEDGIEHVSDTLTIYRRKDFFLPDPLNFGIAFGFTGMVRRILHEEQPDLIVCNKVLFWTSFGTVLLRLTGHRVLLLTDALVGMTWWPRNVLPKVIMGIGGWTMGWLVLLCAERIVTFHPQPDRLLKLLGIAHKTQVIPTGLDPAEFSSHKASSENASVTVTYVGRLESVKGVDDFLAAASVIKNEFPELHIRVVGWYKDAHPLVEQYRNIVEFTGLREDIPALLSSSDIFVLPSYSEGLSNALMEAMASGCACIATEVGGNRFLLQSGASGLLFPPGDSAALQAHMRRLLQDSAKRRSLGAAARKRIEDIFSWKVVGTEYQQVFSELMIPTGLPRVALLSAFLTPYRSGAEACVEEVARELSDRYAITVITARLSRELPRHDMLGKVPVVRVGFGYAFDKWLFPFLAPFAARRLRTQILHAVLESFAGLALVLCRYIMPSLPRILTCQSTNTRFLLKIIHRSADHVTVISRALQARAATFGCRSVTLIPNGLRLADIPHDRKEPGRILFVGRLRSMKGIDTLLQAFAQLPHSVHLRIVGEGPERSTLEQRSSTLGISDRVKFVGFVPVPRVYEEFARAEIFCGLSRHEAFGNVFAEAQAAGCAVVGTNIEGIPDIVQHERTGLLVPPDDPAAAASALKRLLEDAELKKQLVEAGRKNALQYDWGEIAEKYGEVYEQNT